MIRVQLIPRNPSYLSTRYGLLLRVESLLEQRRSLPLCPEVLDFFGHKRLEDVVLLLELVEDLLLFLQRLRLLSRPSLFVVADLLLLHLAQLDVLLPLRQLFLPLQILLLRGYSRQLLDVEFAELLLGLAVLPFALELLPPAFVDGDAVLLELPASRLGLFVLLLLAHADVPLEDFALSHCPVLELLASPVRQELSHGWDVEQRICQHEA